MKKQYQIVIDLQYGYRRLEPLPMAEELEHFYREQYYDLVATGGRAPDLHRLMQSGEEAQSELEWLFQTLWRDVQDILTHHVGNKSARWLLDVGCGTGHFAQYMQQFGWQVVGVEPSRDAAEVAKSFGIVVFNFVEECSRQINRRFDAVTLLNVLEHVPDPTSLLQNIRPLLDKEGILVIQVPNDFSALQECAYHKLQTEPWWIAIPDHINYFNFESLVWFLEQLNFRVVDMLGDFPMEIFLLFGEVYIGNPEVGHQCHKKRVSFELSLPVELRRNLYRALPGMAWVNIA